ncbi:interleukin-1 receptor-associated kinase 1-binding protein 1 [Protopterus annectens]|uniref:interleukin-1 receptor-associated kinase 1-binding protein 1 n=1 Tax=Protopterus annectens TaxID=7888 RepID=UPI001CF9E453|nr:interleukin-1 receptor-associated kinase 1-binding protein 1 [Protopterus annectens]
MALTPSRVFAALIPAETSRSVGDRENEFGVVQSRTVRKPGEDSCSGVREVQVRGTAERSIAPDRARVSLRVKSKKEVAQEAKNSVSRRLEYILQAVRQQGIREENMTVTRDFRRVENAYHMEAEVGVIFSDFGKMQNVCNLLVEKLDSTVVISPPYFYLTAEASENLKREVCLAAVASARNKAQEVCRAVGQSLGKPLVIKEEEMKEWEGLTDDLAVSNNHSDTPTMQQKIKNATISVSCKVFASFEIKTKEKSKKNN